MGHLAVAHPYLQELNETLGETVALALPAGDNAYLVDQIKSDHAIQVRDWTGVQIPMYLQSTGRVFLAARSDLALERYLSASRMAYAAKSAAPQKNCGRHWRWCGRRALRGWRRSLSRA